MAMSYTRLKQLLSALGFNMSTFTGAGGATLSYGAVLRGAGTPEANVAAPIGTLYLRSDGGAATTLYVKESGAGNTGWVAK